MSSPKSKKMNSNATQQDLSVTSHLKSSIPEWMKSGKMQSAESGERNEGAYNEQSEFDSHEREIKSDKDLTNMESDIQRSRSVDKNEIVSSNASLISSLIKSSGINYRVGIDPSTNDVIIWDPESKHLKDRNVPWKADKEQKGNMKSFFNENYLEFDYVR